MNIRFINASAKLLILALAAFLSACASEKPVEQPAHVKLSECALIADRSERTRCIDAATRHGEAQNP